MRLGFVCTRTLIGAILVLAPACSNTGGGQDQYKGKDAGAGFVCPTSGDAAVVCIDAAAQTDATQDSGADVVEASNVEAGNDDGSTSGGS